MTPFGRKGRQGQQGQRCEKSVRQKKAAESWG